MAPAYKYSHDSPNLNHFLLLSHTLLKLSTYLEALFSKTLVLSRSPFSADKTPHTITRLSHQSLTAIFISPGFNATMPQKYGFPILLMLFQTSK